MHGFLFWLNLSKAIMQNLDRVHRGFSVFLNLVFRDERTLNRINRSSNLNIETSDSQARNKAYLEEKPEE